MADPRKRKNAIERRVSRLARDWNDFAAEPDARMLRWLIPDDDVPMIDVFLEAQNLEGAEIPDFVLRLEAPFESASAYGFQLVEAIREAYDENRDDVKESDLDASWECPSPKQNESGIGLFARTCASFREHYSEMMELIAVALMPSEISDSATWQSWLEELLEVGGDDSVRYSVVDRTEAPMLDELAEAQPEKVMTISPNADLQGAINELANQGPPGDPGVQFRKNFIGMTTAAKSGDTATMEKRRDFALKTAKEQNWHSLQCAVYMAVAAQHLGAGDDQKAIEAYQEADGAAAEAERHEDPSGLKLRVQSHFGIGVAHFGENRFLEAANVYEQAAPMAKKAEDPILTVEAWRMAGYCYEQADERDAAWECGWNALEEGEGLEDEIRQNGTLPYAGQSLLRLKKDEERVRRRMEELVGPDWESKVEGSGNSS